jgi:hypothetical protein
MDHQYRDSGLVIFIIDETILADFSLARVPAAVGDHSGEQPRQMSGEPSANALLNTTYDWNLTIPMLADPGADVARRYGVVTVPTLILVDAGGRITHRWTGIPHPGGLAAGIQQLVGGPMAHRPPAADGAPER